MQGTSARTSNNSAAADSNVRIADSMAETLATSTTDAATSSAAQPLPRQQHHLTSTSRALKSKRLAHVMGYAHALGITNKIIQYYDGDLSKGGFKYAAQISERGKMRQYGSKEEFIGVIVQDLSPAMMPEGDKHMIREERIRRKEAVSLGTRAYDAFMLTGPIKFHNTKYMLIEHYNSTDWHLASDVTVLSSSRVRTAPKRDLSVSKELQKHKKEKSYHMTSRLRTKMSRMWQGNLFGEEGWLDENEEGIPPLSDLLSDRTKEGEEEPSFCPDKKYRESKKNIEQVKNLVVSGYDYFALVYINQREKHQCRIDQEVTALTKAKEEHDDAKTAFESAEQHFSTRQVDYEQGRIDYELLNMANFARWEAEDKFKTKEQILNNRMKKAHAIGTAKEKGFDELEKKTKAMILDDKVEGKALARNFLLSTFYDKLRGKIPGKAQELEHVFGFKGNASEFFHPNNELLLKVQTSMKLKKETHQTKKRKPDQQPHCTSSNQTKVGRKDERRMCISCNKSKARARGLCRKCTSKGEEPLKFFCPQCKVVQVLAEGRRCKLCTNHNIMCVKCGVRRRNYAGGVCSACRKESQKLP